jgi:tetratricopeptide (TPR) repeat protein
VHRIQGKIDESRKDLEQLASLRDTLIHGNDKYWADQVDIERESATARIAMAEGKHDEALRQMRAAADHEDSTDKHNVTPGAILPARELLGEMLLELKRPAAAMVEFEATLRTAPNRFNALAGVARAAKMSGDIAKGENLLCQAPLHVRAR